MLVNIHGHHRQATNILIIATAFQSVPLPAAQQQLLLLLPATVKSFVEDAHILSHINEEPLHLEYAILQDL